MGYLPGKIQEVRYGSAAELLYFATRIDGLDVKPSAITVTLYDPTGTQLVAATNMTAATVTTEGWETYTSRTAEFTIGATVTEATSAATGRIKEQTISGTGGALYLVDIRGTWAGSKTITDDGDTTGSATSSSTPWLALYSYSLDASATGTWELGEMYQAKVSYTVSTVAYVDWFYFDIVFAPYRPVVTTGEINQRHPEWSALRDEYSHDWQQAILAGHAELSRRIRAMGKRPAFIVVRDELYPLEFAFIEAEIASRATGMTDAERKYWTARREDAWTARGEFHYSESQDEADVDTDMITLGSRLTR